MPDLLAKVNSRCPKPGILIALHSPYAILETALRICHPEKSQHVDAIRSRAVRSLQSMLSNECREKRACFAHFARKGGGFSLHVRLVGGESGIRNHAGIENKGTPLFSALSFLNNRSFRRGLTHELTRRRVPSASERACRSWVPPKITFVKAPEQSSAYEAQSASLRKEKADVCSKLSPIHASVLRLIKVGF